MLKVGDTCYFIAHAYYHYVGEVVEVLGVRRVALRNVVQVHSCTGNWTDFFAKGFAATKARYDIIGESPDLSYIVAHHWPHPIPKERS